MCDSVCVVGVVVAVGCVWLLFVFVLCLGLAVWLRVCLFVCVCVVY